MSYFNELTIDQQREVMKIAGQAMQLISVDVTWTQHAYGRDAHGREVDPEDDAACRVCGVGAVRKVTRKLGKSSRVADMTVRAIEEVTDTNIILVNDARGREAVVEILQSFLKVARATRK